MSKKLTIAFIGDVMLGRGVNAEIQGGHQPEHFWGNTLDILRSADAVIANLECAITNHLRPWRKTQKVFHFRAGPEAIDVLRAARIECVSLANNHILDFEEEGLFDTVKFLDRAGIHHAGAGKNLDEARRPAIFDINDLKAGFICMTDNEPAFAAGVNTPGVNYREINTDARTLNFLKDELKQARDGGAELMTLSLHWGPNMAESPSQKFREFAHAAIDAGINIIHGHSAHIFQGVEKYRNGLIMFDTGDFLDDYAVDPILRNDWSFIFLIEIESGRLNRLRMIPVRLTYAMVNLAEGEEFETIRNRMINLCNEFTTGVLKTSEGLELDF